MINWPALLDDHKIPYWTDGKNVSPGWTNIQCPMCDDHSNHGGFSPEGRYSCWRCGSHPIKEVVFELIHIDWWRIRDDYVTSEIRDLPNKRTEIRSGTKPFSLPAHGPLRGHHLDYLSSRGFDGEKLERDFQIRATSHLGPYKFRILIPILWGGKIVSYQGRDWTGKSELRYKTCPIEEEIIHHKHVLYCPTMPQDSIVVVEGVTDVWRLGPGSAATFGTGFTREQILVLSSFKRVFLLYDGEPAATDRAHQMIYQLSALGCDTELILLDGGDPAEMSQGDADNLMADLLGGKR